jgi:hypothetical protein
MAKQLTFEQVDAHIEKTFKQPKSATKGTVSIEKLKSIYVVVRPVLQLVSNFPFIPTKWKQAISTFITTLDLLTATV